MSQPISQLSSQSLPRSVSPSFSPSLIPQSLRLPARFVDVPKRFANADESDPASSRSGRPAEVDGTTFRVVRSPERLPEILALRRAAFGGAGRPVDSVVVGTDPRDEKALMVIAETEAGLIGSVRLRPPLAGPLLHPTSRFAGAVEALPARSELIESSRACIHPDHQGKGLFWSLVAHMIKAATSFGRPHLVAGTEERLWPYWRRCGFVKTSCTYRREGSDAEFHVVLLKLEDALAGRGLAPELARILREL